MTLPKSISPSPIMEAVVEIRFDSLLVPEVIIGKLYQLFVAEFPKMGDTGGKLPILQLPEQIRLIDDNLKFQPYYRFANDNFVFQFGPKVITLSNSGAYVGWDAYFKKILNTINTVVNSDVINNVVRFGIRYINFFESADIYKHVTLEVKKNNASLNSTQLFTRATLNLGKFMGILQVANNTDLTSGLNNIVKNGSIIDIDIVFDKSEPLANLDFSILLNEGHKEAKKLFFELLKSEFLATLEPKY